MRLNIPIGQMIAETRNLSLVRVHVPKEMNKDEVISWFEKQHMFRLGANTADMEKEYETEILNDPFYAREEYFGLYPNGDPFVIQKTKDGFSIRVRELEVRPYGEDDYTPGYGETAFRQALEDLKERYGDEDDGLTYEGCINYMLRDQRCGQLVSWEISDDPKEDTDNKTYDWIGKCIGECLKEQTYIPKAGMPSTEEAAKLHFASDHGPYGPWTVEGAIQYILDAQLDEEVTEETDFLVIGDGAQRPEMKKKAEELNIPVLSAEAFFEQYGLQEYGKEDMPQTLWEILTDGEPQWGIHEKDAEETIRILQAYGKWIDPEVLQAATEKIIHLAERKDPEAGKRLENSLT